jgi:preprotein translocase subunit SecF
MVDVQKQTPHKSELTTEIKLMGGAVVEVQKQTQHKQIEKSTKIKCQLRVQRTKINSVQLRTINVKYQLGIRVQKLNPYNT